MLIGSDGVEDIVEGITKQSISEYPSKQAYIIIMQSMIFALEEQSYPIRVPKFGTLLKK